MRKASELKEKICPYEIAGLYNDAAIGNSVRFMTIFTQAFRAGVFKRGNNCQDRNGYTYLHYAAANGHLEIVQFLINTWEKNRSKFQLEIDSATNKLNETAVLLAVRHNHTEVAEFLLKHGADAYIADIYNVTCRDYAQKSNNEKLLDILPTTLASM